MNTFDPSTRTLLLKRMEERVKQGRAAGVYQLGEYYTPEKMLEEAKKGTPAGDEFLWAEKKLMDELKRRM